MVHRTTFRGDHTVNMHVCISWVSVKESTGVVWATGVFYKYLINIYLTPGLAACFPNFEVNQKSWVLCT